jgi:transcription termination factor 2
MRFTDRIRLYQHQEEAVAWMKECEARVPSGGILAHDMGLGKTIDVLCFIASHLDSEVGSNLIVVPNNLLRQWSEEFASYVVDTDESDFAIYATGNRAENIRGYRVVLTTYDTILSDFRRGKNDVLGAEWNRIFLDEAHEIRNRGSIRNRVISTLVGASKWCLTGTPIWNKAADLRSLKRFISPENFELVTKEQIHIRTKEILNLPKYTLTETACKFTLAQFKEYKGFERKILKASLTGEGKKDLLGNIVRLRRLCNHTDGDLRTENIGDWGHNAKFSKVKEIMDAVPAGEKVVIFSSWVTTLMSIRKNLEAIGHHKISMFHGEMGMAERQKDLCDFRDGENNIMLISIKCGGVGLNLVCANHIVIFEPQYSPFSEKQAIDRVYRIGQRREVFVHRLYLRFSIEHWMNSIKDWKSIVKRVMLDDSDENEEEALEAKAAMFQRYVILAPQIERAIKQQKEQASASASQQTE